MCNPEKQLNGKVTEMLKTANSVGYANQEAKILEAVQNGFKGYDLKPSQTASAAFFRTNEKLNALIKATVSDLKRAETAILRMSNDKYRKAIFNAQVFANTGAGTYEKAVDMACRDMLRAGLNCVEYKNGARHTLSDYAEMALRTADKRAYLYGEGQKRQEWGIAAVIVNNRRGGCPHCAPYVGRVFIDDVYSGRNKSDGKYPLLSEAIRGGLFHPRCKDSTSTYFEGITEAKPVTKEELAEMDRREKLEQKQSYCKNEAKKNRRIAEHSLDPDNQKSYTHRAEVFEQKAAAVKKLQTDKNTKKSSAVDSWESENYKNSTEKGLLITSDGNIIDFGGTDHHVTGRADDIKLMDGAVFTHNHPTDNTFSQNDIVTGLVKGNLKELRAVTSAGDVHILVNNGATEGQRKKFSAAYQQRRMKAANAADSKIRKGERINKDEYIKSRLEAFMSENAENYNLTYVKSSIGKSEKPLANSGESGIIKIRGEGMYRKSKQGKIEPMPKKQFHRLEKSFRRRGGIIQHNPATDDYLSTKHAEGITYDSKTILLKQNPGRASVFEELIHAHQYRTGKNDGSYLSRLNSEIDAQRKLLRHSTLFQLTQQEIEQTKSALKSYKNELEEYYKKGGK